MWKYEFWYSSNNVSLICINTTVLTLNCTDQHNNTQIIRFTPPMHSGINNPSDNLIYSTNLSLFVPRTDIAECIIVRVYSREWSESDRNHGFRALRFYVSICQCLPFGTQALRLPSCSRANYIPFTPLHPPFVHPLYLVQLGPPPQILFYFSPHPPLHHSFSPSRESTVHKLLNYSNLLLKVGQQC